MTLVLETHTFRYSVPTTRWQLEWVKDGGYQIRKDGELVTAHANLADARRLFALHVQRAALRMKV